MDYVHRIRKIILLSSLNQAINYSYDKVQIDKELHEAVNITFILWRRKWNWSLCILKVTISLELK